MSVESDDEGHKLKHTLTSIHAVARHLLNLDVLAAKDLFVGVQPLGSAWRVEVKYAGFMLQESAFSLPAVLDQTLAKLMGRVSERLEADTRMIKTLNQPNAEPATKLLFAHHSEILRLVRSVGGVLDVALEEGPGEVTIVARIEKVLDCRNLAFLIGLKLGYQRPAAIAYKLKLWTP